MKERRGTEMVQDLKEVPVYAGYGTKDERPIGWARVTKDNRSLLAFVPRHGYIMHTSALLMKSKEFTSNRNSESDYV